MRAAQPRLTRRYAFIGWALLAAVIVAASLGHWSPNRPGIWAPLLINPEDVAENVAIYVGFGVLGAIALNRQGWRPVARVTGVALVFSFVIESMQLYTTDRVASVTDIVSAGVGALIGAAVVIALRRPK